ncbi:hypothetical protein COCNU_06G020810 [Cocos nucifera]|uniref:Uncharacterized protein n=1 Tax=Cocos nucifera TaxID=13894 RepID=A0A8K0IE48_COCNU|nr:hypothetical protein COCNU_06G020810 [Cocos nucifera]
MSGEWCRCSTGIVRGTLCIANDQMLPSVCSATRLPTFIVRPNAVSNIFV